MRIVSLLPSATEILFALGFDQEIVGVSHECDFPAPARTKPSVIHSRLPQDATPGEIDRLVRDYVARGESLYTVDAELLERLKPDLIITQDLCQVCAASPDDLAAALRKFANPPEVLCLNPQDLGDVWRDILWVGEATKRARKAEAVLEGIGERLGALERQLDGLGTRPAVAILEWLDPFYVGGHWVPEMIEIAGGKDALGKRRTPSFRVTAEKVIAASPDVMFIAQCGYSAVQARDEYLGMKFPDEWNDIPAVRNSRVYALEASGYFSRPAPRLIAGIEALAGTLHPEIAVSQKAERIVLAILVEVKSAPSPSARVASA